MASPLLLTSVIFTRIEDSAEQTAILGVPRTEPHLTRVLGAGVQSCHAGDRKQKSSSLTETLEGLGSQDIKATLYSLGAQRAAGESDTGFRCCGRFGGRLRIVWPNCLAAGSDSGDSHQRALKLVLFFRHQILPPPQRLKLVKWGQSRVGGKILVISTWNLKPNYLISFVFKLHHSQGSLGDPPVLTEQFLSLQSSTSPLWVPPREFGTPVWGKVPVSSRTKRKFVFHVTNCTILF